MTARPLPREHQRRLAGLSSQDVLYLLGGPAEFAWWRSGMQAGLYDHDEWHGTYETRSAGMSFREWGQEAEAETVICWRAIRDHRAALPAAVIDEADALHAAITRNAVAVSKLAPGRRDPETGDRTDPAGAHREVLWAEGLELVRQRAALVVRLLPLSAPESEYVGQLPLF